MNVNYDGAYACASNMLSIENKIEREVEDIKTLIQSLINSGEWNSSASNKYNNEISNVFSECEQLFIILRKCINHMNTSIDSYKELENKIIGEALGDMSWHTKQ